MASSANNPSSDSALALYVHWPFCKAKCPYCDFNSHVVDTVDHPKWSSALRRELDHMAGLSKRNEARLNSIFFGGGTPSLMAPQTMADVIDHARDVFAFTPDIEITMEANPTSVEAEKLAGFHSAGVNRLSIGIQSLRQDALTFLGREHSADEALMALTTAQGLFDRVSADFIYARPQQSLDDWADELKDILALGLNHLSLYQLTLEPGTAFYSLHQRGHLPATDPAFGRDAFDLTQDMTATAGCPQYEISNHARQGDESRHNLIYWQAQDWLGIGPGSYGRFWANDDDGPIRMETRSRRAPQSWLDDTMANGHAIDQVMQDSVIDYAHEALMMGMRLTQGVDLSLIEALSGDRDGWLDLNAVEILVDQGLLTIHGDHVKLTASGQPLLNSILDKMIK